MLRTAWDHDCAPYGLGGNFEFGFAFQFEGNAAFDQFPSEAAP
jgi:hypothetical protein